MGRLRLAITLGCCFSLLTFAASSETRKAGLWELTTTMTWQRSPSAPGAEPAKAGSHSSQVCLTQEMIDKYGALLPQSRGQCHIENKVMKPGGLTADYVCSGTMTGTGLLESNWSDTEHSSSKVHFVGTFQMGSQPKPIEWTTRSTAVFKSASCGNITPQPLPAKGIDNEAQRR